MLNIETYGWYDECADALDERVEVHLSVRLKLSTVAAL
jgi:hypothetical protein